MRTKRHKIRVIYKSGAEMNLTCNSFAVQRNRLGEMVGIKWDGAIPEPLHAGVDDIAAIWQVS